MRYIFSSLMVAVGLTRRKPGFASQGCNEPKIQYGSLGKTLCTAAYLGLPEP